MSILQEYEEIKATLRPGEFDAIERYLNKNPDIYLSDIYYKEEEFKKFDAWWKKEKQHKAYQEYLHNWYVEHNAPAFKGMEPVCFEEFVDNEYVELKETEGKLHG